MGRKVSYILRVFLQWRFKPPLGNCYTYGVNIYYGKKGPAYKLYYHLVIVTKHRESVFNKANQARTEAIIRSKCKKEGYFVQSIAIQPDHIHLLLSLRPTHLISDVVKNIKGYSAFSFNKLFTSKLVWQTGYSINTVSEEALTHVKKYIEDQEEL
jgi:putative transposase